MTILYHKPYLVKETTNGGGEQKTPKNFNHVVYGWSVSENWIIDFYKK